MSRAAFEAHKTFLRQSLAKLRDDHAPEPDVSLLTTDVRLPFTSVTVGTDPASGEAVVFFTLANTERGPRSCPPEVFVLVSLLLAYGGGLSIDDNGTGLAYARLWGGNDRFQLGRILRDPRPGQIVRQDRKADHHEQHPLNFETRGKPKALDMQAEQAAHTTREDAIKTALRYHAKNSHRAEFRQTADEYRADLQDAIRLVDAYFAEGAV